MPDNRCLYGFYFNLHALTYAHKIYTYILWSFSCIHRLGSRVLDGLLISQ